MKINLRNKTKKVAEGAQMILPDTRLDILAYGCTSGSLKLGDDSIRDSFCEVRPGIPFTHPIMAALSAFKALGISRIAMLTPYEKKLEHTLVTHFNCRGIKTYSVGSFNWMGTVVQAVNNDGQDLVLGQLCQIDTYGSSTLACGGRVRSRLGEKK